MSNAKLLAVLMVGVLLAACGGQPSGPVEGDQATDTAAQADEPQVFDDDFESGEVDEWQQGEGEATTTTDGADQ